MTEHVPDRVRVHPGRLSGTVDLPGDKSLSHRALIVGALAGGPIELSGLAPSDDVRSTARCLATLGARVELIDAPDGLSGTIDGPLAEPEDVLDCGNSGTALRLLAGVVAGLGGLSVLTGDSSLRRRPVDRVVRPLREMGADLRARGDDRYPPLVVRGGTLRSVRWESPVASAQVKSALLLAGLVGAVDVEVVSPLRSRDHTERLLAYLDLDVSAEERADGREHVVLVPGPLTPRPIDVLGDPSSATFWMVAAACDGSDGGGVDLPGVCVNRTRTGAIDILVDMGADVQVEAEGLVSGEPAGRVRVRPAPLDGATVAGARVVDAIDELPILALAGALSAGGLEVRDAAELRVKETDRVAGTAATLGALGIEIEERPDGYSVRGGQRPSPGTVDPAGDHRLAMTAAIAGTLATGPVEIVGFRCVATSYPGFLDDLRGLGGHVEVLDGEDTA